MTFLSVCHEIATIDATVHPAGNKLWDEGESKTIYYIALWFLRWLHVKMHPQRNVGASGDEDIMSSIEVEMQVYIYPEMLCIDISQHLISRCRCISLSGVGDQVIL